MPRDETYVLGSQDLIGRVGIGHARSGDGRFRCARQDQDRFGNWHFPRIRPGAPDSSSAGRERRDRRQVGDEYAVIAAEGRLAAGRDLFERRMTTAGYPGMQSFYSRTHCRRQAPDTGGLFFHGYDLAACDYPPCSVLVAIVVIGMVIGRLYHRAEKDRVLCADRLRRPEGRARRRLDRPADLPVHRLGQPADAAPRRAPRQCRTP